MRPSKPLIISFVAAFAALIHPRPGRAAPTVGPETRVDYLHTIDRWNQPLGDPSVVSNGTDYLVLWHTVFPDFTTDPQQVVTRLSADGKVLDPHGISLSQLGETDVTLATSDGEDYFIVGAWLNSSGTNPLGVRVRASDGAVLDTNPIKLPLGSGEFGVASDGTNYLVVWTNTNQNKIRGERVRASDGTVLDPGGFTIITGGTLQHPKVAWTDGSYLLAWSDDRNWDLDGDDIYAARLDSTGASLNGSQGFLVSDDPDDEEFDNVIAAGTEFLATWDLGDAGYFTSSRIVASDGTVLDYPPIAIPAGLQNYEDKGTAYNGTNFVTTFHPRSVLRIGASNGAILDAREVVVPGAAGFQGVGHIGGDLSFDTPNYLGIASNGQSSVVASIDGYNNYIITASFLDSNLNQTKSVDVSTIETTMDEPVSAFDGTNYLVVWREKRDVFATKKSVYAERIRASDGTALDPNGIHLFDTQSEFAPFTIDFDGTDYVVLWADQLQPVQGPWNINITRIRAADGTVLDATPIPVGTGDSGTSPPDTSLRCHQGECLVAWNQNADIYANRFRSSTGAFLDGGGFLVCDSTGSQEQTRVGFDGTDYLVTWYDTRPAWQGFYGGRVTTSGALLDSSRGVKMTVSSNDSLLFDGTHWLTPDTASCQTGCNCWERSDPTTLQKVDEVSYACSQGTSLDAASDGSTTTVVLNDGTTTSGLRLNATDYQALDAVPFSVTAADGSEPHSMTLGPPGGFLVVYGRDASDPGTSQLYYRVVSPRGGGAACMLGSDCLSGTCTAGTCTGASLDMGTPPDLGQPDLSPPDLGVSTLDMSFIASDLGRASDDLGGPNVDLAALDLNGEADLGERSDMGARADLGEGSDMAVVQNDMAHQPFDDLGTGGPGSADAARASADLATNGSPNPDSSGSGTGCSCALGGSRDSGAGSLPFILCLGIAMGLWRRNRRRKVGHIGPAGNGGPKGA